MRGVCVRKVVVMGIRVVKVESWRSCGVWGVLGGRRVRCVARVVVVLSRVRQTVARSCVGWTPCGGVGVGAACSAVGAPGFGSRVCRSAGLVVSGAVRSCRVPSLGMLRGWVRASWKTVAADGNAWPSVFVTLRFL